MSGTEESSLSSGLRQRHLSMIAIAGVIGAGLFVGSGAAISEAGPAALVSYALAGVLVVLVMRMLGEMSAASPATGSFSAYAEQALGRWAGLAIGWLYWWFWVVVLGIEATAGAEIANRWVPGVPQWVWALLIMVVLTATNLYSVRSFGEFEFWFAAIKVTAIVGFIALGAAAVLGLLPTVPSPGVSNLVGHGGFMPFGVSPVFGGLVVIVFSFFGAEIATIAAGESDNPGRAVRAAVRSVVWRILVFYIGSIAVIVTLLPYDSAEVAESPYVAVLDRIGLPAAATVMDVVVFTSVLSCLNSGLYTASRMAYSLSRRGQGPAAVARVSRRGTPVLAVLGSTVVGFVAVAFNYLSPDTVFLFLVNSSGATALLVWLVIAFSQLRLRRHYQRTDPARLTLRMWGYPYLTWITIAGIAAVLAGMAFEGETRVQLLLTLLVAAALVVVGVVHQRRAAVARPEIAPTRG
ncbi:amino acid permease [Saccharopolyspora erythraea]|uniref:Gamma-aminobutyrate permease n=3 Tax=Saccharopolyspora erythraea TaxID=1836 RepID=A4FE30_SACEN|nr:amino acid permease [Saccharopolyspora erythraea]QRK92584.1 amino acid permease [Saccharopolyspora erythraea]CAM02305.1 gamma-aminobutyrate permease [Saccharopolyspora erythraea NRRL 2338]